MPAVDANGHLSDAKNFDCESAKKDAASERAEHLANLVTLSYEPMFA